MQTIGDRLAIAREAKKYSQARLAKAIPCAPEQVSMWETGARKPRIETIAKLARALNVSVGWLKTGVGAMQAGPLDNLTIEDFGAPVGHGKAQPPARKPAALEIDTELLQAALEAAIDSNVPREQFAEVVIEAYRVTHRTKRVDELPQLVKMLIS